MNTKILEQYGLELSKRSDGSPDINGHWLSNYIYMFRCADDVSEFIDDLNLAINGQFEQIEDPDWTASLGSTYLAEIRPDEFAIWQEGTEEMLIPLKDMKEILLSWKEIQIY